MANRREFLQGAAAVSALPLIGGSAIAAAPEAKASPLYKVIFDQRFAEARDFADNARLSGARVQGFESDITSLWFNDLHHRWLKSPAAIAGVTAPNAVFCLERLAWDYRMRLAFLAEHHRLTNGGMRHAVRISSGAIHQAELDAAGNRWTARIAGHLAQLPLGPARGPASVDLQLAALSESKTLVSWIIAPANRTSV